MSEDTHMNDAGLADEFALSEDERRVLSLHDRLHELQLEMALLLAARQSPHRAVAGKQASSRHPTCVSV